jgi:hypothetical protein
MTASVFQVHPTVFDANHRADVAGFDILDDQTQFRRMFGRAGLASSRGQHIGSIAIHHAAILESLAAKQRYGAPGLPMVGKITLAHQGGRPEKMRLTVWRYLADGVADDTLLAKVNTAVHAQPAAVSEVDVWTCRIG